MNPACNRREYHSRFWCRTQSRWRLFAVEFVAAVDSETPQTPDTTTPRTEVRGSDAEIGLPSLVRAMLSPGQTRQQPGNACDGEPSMRQLRCFDIPLTGSWWPHRMSQKEAAMR